MGPIRGIIDSALKIWNFDQARELAAPLLPRATLEVTVKSGTPSLPKTR